MEEIVIIGAGGFGREVKLILDFINKINPTYKFLGFIDDAVEAGTEINDFPVLGSVKYLSEANKGWSVIIATASAASREKIYQKLKPLKYKFPTIIHPSCIVGNDDITVGVGNIICAGSILTCNISVGNFNIINLMTTIGHDTIIKDYCSIMPGVNVSGEVILENGVYIGTGAKVINQVRIGSYTIIGAGAVVAKNLPANCTAVGMPAKPIKFH